MAAHLQALFSSPRNASNPRVASTYTPQFTTGEDGKLYKLASEGDRNKFHILSEEEIEEELRAGQEMANTLKTLNPKKPATKKSPVKLGTGSRSKKIAKRAWEKKMESSQENENANSPHTDESTPDQPEQNNSSEDVSSQTLANLQKKYTANIAVIERLISEKTQLEVKVKELQYQLHQSKKLNKYQSAQQFNKTNKESSLSRSLDVHKTDRNDNLELLESLYAQQKESEKLILSLQAEILTLKKDSNQDGTKTDSQAKHWESQTNEKYLRNLKVVDQLFQERKQLLKENDSLQHQLRALKRSIALNESPNITSIDPNGDQNLSSEKNRLNKTSPEVLQTAFPQKSLERKEESDEAPPEFEESGDEEEAAQSTAKQNSEEDIPLKRSSSPTMKQKTPQSSEYMNRVRQSEEKYFAKKKLAEERERQARVEQEAYEYELERKRLRVSEVMQQ